MGRLRKEKSSNIKITDIRREDGDVIITYEFKTLSDSNDFLRLANDLSDIRVVLMKYIEPKNGEFGRGEIKASSKPNPLLDRQKRND